jgi:DNA-binding protein HU-beta
MKKYVGIVELTEALAEKEDITQMEAKERVKSFIDVLEDQLLREGRDGVQIIDTLTLRKVERKARKGRNPKNPEEEYEIPARLDIKCVLGKSLAEKLNK